MLSQKSEIASLQQKIRDYETQLHEVMVSKNEISASVEKYLVKIQQLEQTVAANDRLIEELRLDLASAEKRFQTPKPTINDFLPIAAWRPTEFDGELNSKITSITASPSLEPSAKLHAVYHEISSYFAAALQSRDAALTQLNDQKSTLYASLHDFLMSLQIALSTDPVPLSDFIVQKCGDRLIALVNQIVTQNGDLKREKEQLFAALGCLNEQLGLPTDSDLSTAIQQMSNLRNAMAVQGKALEQRKRKCRDLRDQVRTLTKKFGNEAVHFDSQTKSLHSQIDSLTAKVADLTSANQTLKKDFHALKASHRELQLQYDQSCSALIADHEAAVREAQSGRDSVECQLRQEVARLQQQLAAGADSLDDQAATIKVLKKTIHSQKASLLGQEREIEALREELSRVEAQPAEPPEFGKLEAVPDAFAEARADLQRQCEAQRQDLERLARELTSAMKSLQASKSENLELRRAAARRDRELKAAQEQTARERALQEASVRAARLSAESALAQRLRDQQAAADADKRRLLGAVAEALPAFLGSGPVDDRSAREAVGHARAELARLSDSDRAVRTVVGAGPHEHTADAVARRLREGT
jgi:chromosome segregation ATPase